MKKHSIAGVAAICYQEGMAGPVEALLDAISPEMRPRIANILGGGSLLHWWDVLRLPVHPTQSLRVQCLPRCYGIHSVGRRGTRTEAQFWRVRLHQCTTNAMWEFRTWRKHRLRDWSQPSMN